MGVFAIIKALMIMGYIKFVVLERVWRKEWVVFFFLWINIVSSVKRVSKIERR